MARFITGMDIGTAAIKTAVVEILADNSVKVVALSRQASAGIRKGVVTYVDDACRVVQAALEKSRGVSKMALKNIYLNVGGSKSQLKSARGMVMVSRADNEIYQDDIDRVIKSTQDIVRAHNRMTIHTINKEFLVDGIPNIEDPTGLTGNRLELEAFVIDAFAPDIRNIGKLVEKSGGVIGGLFFDPISVSRAILTRTQKDLGVVLIDIGAGTTGVSVYEEGKLMHAAVLPIGSANITNDLAIGLKLSVEVAEVLKLSLGYAVARDISIKEKLDMKKIDPKAKQPISRRFFSEVIEVRLAEIFELVNNELKSINREKNLPAGAVLTGGGSKMPGIVELAKQELKLPVQLGIVTSESLPTLNQEIAEKVEDPEYANCLGLVLSGYDHIMSEKRIFGNPLSKFLNYFLP